MSDTDILSRIQILLDANTASFETGMKAAKETATTSFDQISSSAKGMATVVTGALTAGKFIEAADGYTQVGARIKRATDDAEEYAMVQARILETANQTFRPLVEAQETYLATSAGLKEMGKNTAEALDIIDSLSYAYTMNAASAEQVASANNWLSKSMIDNKVSGDAFKAMTLAADNLIQDLADHTGKSTIEIKKLGNSGKISLKDLMDTLQKTVDQNKKFAADVPNSWKDGLTAVENNFEVFVGKANETYEITGMLSSGLISLSENMELLAIGVAAVGAAYGTKKLLEYSAAVNSSIAQNIARAQVLAVERQALVAGAAAELSRTSAIATNMQAQVAAAQADALRLTGMQRLAFVEKTLIPLQAAAAVASNAETAASRAHTIALGAETAATSRLAVAKKALMGLVGGPAGLISLGVGLAATMYMVSSSGDKANKTLEEQSRYAAMAADELERLDGAQSKAAKDELSHSIEMQSMGIKTLTNDFTKLTENIMDNHKESREAERIWGALRNRTIDIGEAFKRLNKLEIISNDEINKATELHKKWLEMNVALTDSKTKLDNTGRSIKSVAQDSKDAASAIFSLNDEIDKLFKQADSNIITASITKRLAGMGADDKWIAIVNKYAQVEGAITKNAEGRAVFHKDILNKMYAEYAAVKAQDKAVEARNKKEQERTKLLEQQSKVLQVNSRVAANAAKYNFSGLEEKHGLLPGLLSGIHMQESRGDGTVIGPQTKYGTAKGGFQFLDDTAKRFGLKGNDVFDIGKSADAAGQYLKSLYKMFGTWEKAISAYHAGEGNVKAGTGIGPINHQYVKNVKGYMAGASGVTISSDFGADDAMKAREEYLNFQLQQDEKRKQLESDYETRVHNDLAEKKAQIDTAGFGETKAAELKARYSQWAEWEIAAYKDTQNEKLSSLSDYLKSDEQLTIQYYASRRTEFERDRDLTDQQKTDAYKLLDEQRDYELKNIQFARDQRIFQARQAFMTTSEIMMKSYEMEREEIESTVRDLEERDAKIAASYRNQDRDNDAGRQAAWGDYQGAIGVDTSADSERSNREAIFQAALDWKLITQEEYQQRMLESEHAYHSARTSLALSYAEQIAGSTADSFKAMFGEQSAAFRVMFAVQKGFAIAQSVIAIQQGIANAMALPFPANLGAAATVVAETASIVSNIKSVAMPDGMAHDGMDNIPEEGTWLLDRGERVVDRRTNSDLKDYLAAKNGQGGSGGGQTINIFTLPGQTADISTNDDGSLDVRVRQIVEEEFERGVSNGNSRISKAIQQNLNAGRRYG